MDERFTQRKPNKGNSDSRGKFLGDTSLIDAEDVYNQALHKYRVVVDVSPIIIFIYVVYVLCILCHILYVYLHGV